MSEQGLLAAQEKMRAAGVDPTAIAVFSHYYHELEAGETGLILEDTIRPVAAPARLTDVAVAPQAARAALAETVLIKLNGGLGTSMGMARAKTLLPVREGKTFLDLIVEQVRYARATYGVRLPLILMDSFRTSADSLAALAAYPDLALPGLPLDFVQNQEPKLLTSDLSPVSWPVDPDLEWCPPGHGDLFTAILASGMLDALLDAGFRYANASNADNLGASPSSELAGWFAASGSPFAVEVCRRTAADRKGGHLATRVVDGQLILREVAQTAPEELPFFADEHRHGYFNTNNLWFDLEALRDALVTREAVLGLPLIRNVKTVDPRDPDSPEVLQIETAMGAAVEVFAGSTAIEVERARFLPVKTTNDLLLLRSDVYDVGVDAVPRLVANAAPLVDLDPRFFRTIAAFEARFPAGAPSLRAAASLTVRGDWTFGADVVVHGTGELADPGEPRHVADGALLGGAS